MKTIALGLGSTYYELDFEAWQEAFRLREACIRGCQQQSEVCVGKCRKDLTVDGQILKPGVGLPEVNKCFTGCENEFVACLETCNMEFRARITLAGTPVGPGLPTDFDAEVAPYKTEAAKKKMDKGQATLQIAGPTLAVAGVVIDGLGKLPKFSQYSSQLKMAGIVTGVTGAMLALTGALIDRIKNDPPDRAYLDVWAPRLALRSALSAAHQGLEPDTLRLFLPIFNAAVNIVIGLESIVVCLERATAANAAGNDAAARMQMAASREHARNLAAAFRNAGPARKGASGMVPAALRTLTISYAQALKATRDNDGRAYVGKGVASVIERLTRGGPVSKKDVTRSLGARAIARTDFNRPLSAFLNPPRLATSEAILAAFFEGVSRS